MKSIYAEPNSHLCNFKGFSLSLIKSDFFSVHILFSLTNEPMLAAALCSITTVSDNAQMFSLHFESSSLHSGFSLRNLNSQIFKVRFNKVVKESFQTSPTNK